MRAPWGPLLPLLRLSLRDLKRRPSAALVLVLGLAAGVSSLVALRVGTEGALASMRDLYMSAAGPADLVVLPAGDPNGLLPAGAARDVAADPDVARALPLLAVYAARVEDAARGGLPFLPGPSAAVLVVGADDPCPDAPCRWALEGERRPGVLVGAGWAKERGLGPGSELHLLDRGGAVLTWTVGGSLARSGLGALGYGRVVVAPSEQVATAFGLPSGAASELDLILRPGADPRRVLARLAEKLPGVVVTRPADRAVDVEQRLTSLRAGTDTLGLAGLFLAAFLIYGQFSTRASAQGRSLALLRCTGATRLQVLWIFLVQALLIAIPGAALGAALGVPLARLVAGLMALTANADLRLERVPLGAVLGAAAIGVGTALIAAFWPAFRASRQPAWEGLRARGHAAALPALRSTVLALIVAAALTSTFWLFPAGATGRAWTFGRTLLLLATITAALPGLLARIAAPLARCCARLGPIAGIGASSLRWRPARSGLSAGAVLVSVALVGGASTIGRGVTADVDRWTGRALSWALYLTRAGGFSDEDLALARAIPGVDGVAPISVRPITVRVPGRVAPVSLSALAVDASRSAGDTVVELVPDSPITAAQAVADLQRPDVALATSVVAAELGVRAGDRIEVVGVSGPVSVRIDAIYVDYTQNGYALLVGAPFAREVLGTTRYDALALRLDPDASESEIEASLARWPGVVIETRDQLRARIHGLAEVVLSSLDLLAWLSGGIGLLAVSAALSQSVVERRADLTALAAIGATRAQRVGVVVVEGVITASLGALGGVLVGAAIGPSFRDATTTLGYPIAYVPPWGAMAASALMSVLAALPAAWLPARQVARLPASEALRAE